MIRKIYGVIFVFVLASQVIQAGGAAELISVMNEIDYEMVDISAGKLPDLITEKGAVISAFSALRFPVTQAAWSAIMGRLPSGLQQKIEEGTLSSCPKCPVAYVGLENSPGEIDLFLEKINKNTTFRRCEYKLPSMGQLEYLIRGDVTGNMSGYTIIKDSFSASEVIVTDNNYLKYFTKGNSFAELMVPVGHKPLNTFGIELSNIWVLSRNPKASATKLEQRLTTLVNDWRYGVLQASSGIVGHIYINGPKPGAEGIWLVRECKK